MRHERERERERKRENIERDTERDTERERERGGTEHRRERDHPLSGYQYMLLLCVYVCVYVCVYPYRDVRAVTLLVPSSSPSSHVSLLLPRSQASAQAIGTLLRSNTLDD